MRGSDSVDIKLFHKREVKLNVVRTHYITGFGVGVMMVYALKFNLFGIEVEYFINYFNSFKADV